MCNCNSLDNKEKGLSTIEKSVFEILTHATPDKGFLPYKDAVVALHKFRIDRRLAMKLIAQFGEKGLLERSCGHGIKLRGEDGGRC